MARTPTASRRTRLEYIERSQRDRVAKLVFSRASQDARMFEKCLDELHLHAL
jgi:hypothetical protein